jgi:hypothetical protein
MADKSIQIKVGDISTELVHGQGVKESLEKSSADSVVCFDESITQGADSITYKLSIDRVVFETRKQYEDLRDAFKMMLSVPGTITTREVIRYEQDKPFTIVKNYYFCILDGKDYEMKPEDMSAQSLSFICSDMEEYTE